MPSQKIYSQTSGDVSCGLKTFESNYVQFNYGTLVFNTGNTNFNNKKNVRAAFHARYNYFKDFTYRKYLNGGYENYSETDTSNYKGDVSISGSKSERLKHDIIDGYVTAELSLINKALINNSEFQIKYSACDYTGAAVFSETYYPHTGGYGSLIGSSAYIEYTYDDVIPVTTLTYPLGENLYENSDINFTWEYQDEFNLGQKGYEIQYSANNGASWSTVSGTGEQTYHTFPAGTFKEGTIRYRVRTTSNDGVVSGWAEGTFAVYAVYPVVEVSYPVGVNVNNASATILTWTYSEIMEIGQRSFELQWSSDERNWNVIAQTTENQYCSINANTFPVGTIIWRVRATNHDGHTSTWSQGTFTAIGSTAAPTITDITQSAVPTISWMVNYQDCFEIRLLKNGVIIYSSGLQVGSDIRRFTINKMLSNGVYVAEVRILNTYGYYSEWSNRSFILNLPAPKAAENIVVMLNSGYSISIEGDRPSGTKAYVVRRSSENPEGEILDVYNDEPYVLYKTPLNIGYQYTLRTFGDIGTSGYTDGEWVDEVVYMNNGIIIHNIDDMSDYVVLDKTEDIFFDVKKTESYSKNFRQCIGRIYPVKEQMEWINATRQIEVWVSDPDYQRLLNMERTANSVYYRADGECFLADLEMTSQGIYVGGGRIITIMLTRLDEDTEVVLI